MEILGNRINDEFKKLAISYYNLGSQLEFKKEVNYRFLLIYIYIESNFINFQMLYDIMQHRFG